MCTKIGLDNDHPDPAPIWIEISIYVPIFRPCRVLLFQQQQKREKPSSLYQNYPQSAVCWGPATARELQSCRQGSRELKLDSNVWLRTFNNSPAVRAWSSRPCSYMGRNFATDDFDFDLDNSPSCRRHRRKKKNSQSKRRLV